MIKIFLTILLISLIQIIMDITSNLSKYYDCSGTTYQWDKIFPEMNLNKVLKGCDNVSNKIMIISSQPKTNNFIYSCKEPNIKDKQNSLLEHLQTGNKLLVFIHFYHLGIDHFKLLGKAKVLNHQDTSTFKIALQTKAIIVSKELQISHLAKNKRNMSVH